MLTSSRIPQSAASATPDEELPLVHLVAREAQVGRDVLERDAPPEPVLHRAHPRRHVAERLLGVREREQVVEVPPAHARPAQVVRYDGRLDAPRERSERVEVGEVERVGRADVQRDAVEDQRRERAHVLDDAPRPPARARGGSPRSPRRSSTRSAPRAPRSSTSRWWAVRRPTPTPRKGACSTLLRRLLLRGLALVGRQHQEALALAGVLARALVRGGVAVALALAAVHALALDLPVARLLGGGGRRRLGEEQGAGGGGQDRGRRLHGSSLSRSSSVRDAMLPQRRRRGKRPSSATTCWRPPSGRSAMRAAPASRGAGSPSTRHATTPSEQPDGLRTSISTARQRTRKPGHASGTHGREAQVRAAVEA